MRRGWTYSLFLGFVFLPFVALAMALSRGPVISLQVAVFALGAMVAARIGGWLAILCGGRDYGARAFVLTFVVYILLAGVIGRTFYGLAHPDMKSLQVAREAGALAYAGDFAKDSFAAALYIAMAYGWLIFIACSVGILLFHAILRRTDRHVEG